MELSNDLFHVLYIEDNDQDALLATEYFRSYPDFKLEIAESGKEGLALLKDKNYGALILDNNLTDMKGIDILRILSAQNDKTPVIMLTGSKTEEEVILALRMGAKDYIFKNSDYLPKLPIIVKKTIEDNKEKNFNRNTPINVLYLDYPFSSQEKVIKFLAEKAPNINLTSVNTGQELLKVLEKNNYFDVLLVELILQDNTALELIKEIKFKGVNIPFIIITGKGNEELSVASLKLGASDYIIKSENFLSLLPNSIELAFLQSKLEKEYKKSQENEKELQKSKEVFKELAENSGLVFWVRDLETNKINYVSPSYETLSGKSCESLYENINSFFEIIHPEDTQFVIDNDKNRGDSVNESMFRIITGDGSIKWIKTRSSPMKDSNGKIKSLVGTLQDISQFKNTEHSLIKTTERLNFLISASPGVIFSSRASGDFGTTFMSENVSSILGHNASRFTDDPNFWVKSCHPNDINYVLSTLPDIYLKEFLVYESRFLHADGTYRWLYYQLRLIRNENGDPEEFIGVLIDITEQKRAKRDSNLMSIILNTVEALIITLDRQARVVNFNRACEVTTGYSFEEVKDKNVFDLFIPTEENADVMTVFESMLAGNFPCEFENHWIMKDGTRQLFAWNNSVILGEKGEIEFIVGTGINITDKKIAEEKIRESESRIRNSFDNAAIGMVITGTTGKFLEVNDAFCQMLGYTREELLADTVFDLTYPEDIQLSQSKMKILFEDKSQFINFEKRYIHKSGNIVWARMNTTLNRDKEGKPLYFITQIEDITEWKKSKEKLLEQAALLDITTDAILVRDLDHNIIFWNNGAENLYGYKKEEAIGKNIIDLIHGGKSEKFEMVLKSALKENHWHGELDHIDKFGKALIVDSKWTLMRDNSGNPISVLVVNSDITRKKHLEKEYLRVQRLDSIGTLASGIAHDLNNVLTPMMMSVEILKMRITDQKGLKLLDSMTKSTRHGAALVKQILTFARGIETSYSKVALADIITEVNKILSGSFPKNIDIIINLPEELKPVNGDATQLNQVIMNLMVNARDAMPNGGLIKIYAENIYLDSTFAQMNLEAQPGYYIVITVSDTGTGIPKDIIDKIYEPFFTTKGIGKGTGLGLSTTIGIVKSHGGFINVSSKEGIGTEFKVYLPFAEVSDEMSQIQNSGEMLKGNGETILLIEDDISILEAASQALEQHNYKVIIAGDGVEGVSAYLQNKGEIKLVITNVTLPLMDGHQTIKVILKMNPQEKIILVSGLEQTENIREYGTQIKFIKKPFMASTLLMALHEHLKN